MTKRNSLDPICTFISKKEVLEVTRKRVLEILDATPEVRKDKIAMLKKAITEGTYQIRSADIAIKILKDLILERALTPNGCEYREGNNN